MSGNSKGLQVAPVEAVQARRLIGRGEVHEGLAVLLKASAEDRGENVTKEFESVSQPPALTACAVIAMAHFAVARRSHDLKISILRSDSAKGASRKR